MKTEKESNMKTEKESNMKTEKESNMKTEKELKEEGDGWGAKPYNGEKAWAFINYLVLSELYDPASGANVFSFLSSLNFEY